jgi:uncharacterized protein YbjT (DUF2867 family)
VKVLVTGGTGMIGRALVERLRDHAEVRVLSRRAGPGVLRGDLETGEGLAAAVDGVDAIAHCASAADYRRPERDVAQTRLLLAALGDARPHLLYISIVGVDKIRFGYYRAKLATERLILDSGLPYTILRTTQFHDLALMFLMLLTRGPVAIAPRGFRGQPVDTGEVADRMAGLVLGGPAGRVPDLGGPRVEDAAEMVRAYLAVTGRRRPVLRLPVPGRTAADFRAGGGLLPPDGMRGERTFADYLRSRVRPDGTIEAPYDLRGRFRRR